MKLKGNLQDLLNDPEIAKILLNPTSEGICRKNKWKSLPESRYTLRKRNIPETNTQNPLPKKKLLINEEEDANLLYSLATEKNKFAKPSSKRSSLETVATPNFIGTPLPHPRFLFPEEFNFEAHEEQNRIVMNNIMRFDSNRDDFQKNKPLHEAFFGKVEMPVLRSDSTGSAEFTFFRQDSGGHDFPLLKQDSFKLATGSLPNFNTQYPDNE